MEQLQQMANSGSLPRPWKSLQEPAQDENLQRVNREMGDNLPRVCLLIEKVPHMDASNERYLRMRAKKTNAGQLTHAAQALAEAFNNRPDLNIQLITRGSKGALQQFSERIQHAFSAKQVRHKINPKPGHGCELAETAGAVLSSVGAFYIMIAGGENLARESKSAYDRGAVLLPLMFTGGASNFEFPHILPEIAKPRYITDEQWYVLKVGPASKAAQVVVEIIAFVLKAGSTERICINLDIGDDVQVYSRTDNEWFSGRVVEVGDLCASITYHVGSQQCRKTVRLDSSDVVAVKHGQDGR